MIEVEYNGSENLPLERNHITKFGYSQMKKQFNSVEEAVFFWLECEFYSGAITPLDDIIPKGYTSELVDILNEEPLSLEEIILEPKELYNIMEEEA